MNHLLSDLRAKPDADLLALMDAACLLSHLAERRPADYLAAEWLDGLGELASLEYDRRLRAREYQQNELARARSIVGRDPLTSALFGPRGDSGYGAQPHAERREGYPSGQADQPETCHRPPSTWPIPARQAGSRKGSQRAEDAAPRPEKPAAGVPTASPFLHKPEKSSD